jgi:hypothetical protein
MMTLQPACWRLYKSELEIINTEIFRLNRLRKASQLLGLPIAALGLIALFFPNLLISNVTVDSLSKFSSILFGSVFFATINFFNKGDLVSLKKRKCDLEVFIEAYDGYEQKTDVEQKKLKDDCEKIIQKRQGL